MIILAHVLGKMNINIFYAVYGFGIKKIKCVMGGRQMAVHAVRHKSLGIVDMGGGFPGIVSKLDFMAGCTELRCGGSDHGVIAEAEKGKRNEYTETHKGSSDNKFFHFTPLCLVTRLGEWINIDC